MLPPILEGADMIVRCEVGAGCTEAGLIAIIHKCLKASESEVSCVILMPSNHHSSQTAERLKTLAGEILSLNIVSGNEQPQHSESLPALIQIRTATHYVTQLRDNKSFPPAPNIILLFETDSMIARGAKASLIELGNMLTTKPQVIICTSQNTRSIKHVSRVLQREPISIDITPNTEIPASISQYVLPVPEHLKTSLLLKLQRRKPSASKMVITKSEETAAKLARRLRTGGSSAVALINANTTDSQDKLQTRFDNGKIRLILVSRQNPAYLSVARASQVIHYDIPSNTDDYFDTLRSLPNALHLNIVSPRDEQLLLDIEDSIGRPLFRDTLPDFDYTLAPPMRTTSPKKKKRLRHPTVKPRTHTKKTEWDPEIPRSWGDRDAPRKSPEKIPLSEWSPEPLPAIWYEEKTSVETKDKKHLSSGSRNRGRRKNRRHRSRNTKR
jgi:ATP-dependent RNA helicase RhlE